jgi:hypothetical protein
MSLSFNCSTVCTECLTPTRRAILTRVLPAHLVPVLAVVHKGFLKRMGLKCPIGKNIFSETGTVCLIYLLLLSDALSAVGRLPFYDSKSPDTTDMNYLLLIQYLVQQ